MKSLALSLLVALGVSLGTAPALAETTRTQAQGSPVAAAAESMQVAKQHQERAEQYRALSRAATEKAKAAQKVVDADLKQGFTYEAGVEAVKVQKYQQEAQLNLVLAAREDELAAQYRAKAQKEMLQFQQSMVAPTRR